MGSTIALIPLAPKAKLSSALIKADLAAKWPDLPRAKSAEAKKDQFCLRIGKSDIVIAIMRAPIPCSDLEGPCKTGWLWQDAEAAQRAHVGHLVVTLSSEEGPIEQSRLLTQVCTSILATCAEAPGVLWWNGKLLVPSQVFQKYATEVMPDALPLYIWVDFRVEASSKGKTMGFTTGMAALGHMEFETECSPEPPTELRERLFGLANHVLENGPVISDGDTIGDDASQGIRVAHCHSAYGHEGKVVRLVYGSAETITLNDLEGKWQMISAGKNGNFAPPGVTLGANICMFVADDRYTITQGGALGDKGTIQLDASKSPVHFDQHVTWGDDVGSVHLGIIQLANGELEHCQAKMGQPRPNDFSRDRTDDASLARFRRV